MKKIIIASTSTVHGSGYLDYLLPTLQDFFKGVRQLIFIPYARPGGMSYDQYTSKTKKAFAKIAINVKGLHEFEDPKTALRNAEAIFTGGGNTFELVYQIYNNAIFETLKKVVEDGTRYLGTSAGSNICGVSMMNTNDMPIVYPPSFKTLEFIPFNINAHYLDPNPSSTHMGETRETRIKEFHVFNGTSVLGLREGSWLEVHDDVIHLRGKLSARLFKADSPPLELNTNTQIVIS